jgi:hypothetical protein
MPTRSRLEDDPSPYAQRILELEEKLDALCTDIDGLVTITHRQAKTIRALVEDRDSLIDEVGAQAAIIEWLITGSNKHENAIAWIMAQEEHNQQ